MTPIRQTLAALAVLGATATASVAAPIALPAGDTIDTFFYLDAEVTAPDPDWFGTTEATGIANATRIRDGFDGFGVVEGLYNVSASVLSTVTRATNGQLVFGYDFSAMDLSGAGDNGPINFVLRGFAGYDVTFAWTGAVGIPYVPFISRSADGDAITFEFFDPLGIMLAGANLETFLFAVDAPSFRMNGTGEAGLFIDSFGVEQVALVGALPVPAAIPLPAGGLLLLAGLGGLAALRRRTA